jgi:hypothetical protein
MKCRACWTDKAYVREISGWRAVVYSWLGMVPLKCHHCYHKFTVPWFLTIGKRLTPPAFKVRSSPAVIAGQIKPLTSRSDDDSSGQRLRHAA